MAITAALLTTFLANAFVAANNAISDTSIDGGVANAVSCLPQFLRKDTSFDGRTKKLAERLETQMGPHADLAKQTVANAEAIVEVGTPSGFKDLLIQEGLDEDTLWDAFLKQPSAKKLYDDADAATQPHTEWLVKQGLKLWLQDKATLDAMRHMVFDTIFKMARDIETIKNSAVHVLPLTKDQIEALIADFGHQGIREADYYTQLSQSAETLKALQTQLEALTNDDPEVLAKRDEAEKAIDDGLFELAAELLEQAEEIDAARIEEFERDVLRPRRESQAKSAYARALLEETRINFPDAYKHALRAHELAPDNDDYLFKAQSRAFHAADYKKGLELGEEMMARAEARYGEQSKEYAVTCNQTANCAQFYGDQEKAEKLYRRAIKIGEDTLGPNHPNLAIRLNNLANLLKTKGDLDAAEPLYRRDIEITEKALGANHPDLATSLNNLAGLLRQKGDLDAAEPLYRRDIEITEKALGANHPDLATSLNNLAGLLRQKGDYNAAEPLYLRAIDIGEETLGPHHPDLATWLNNLAGLLLQKGDYDAAEPLYRRAIDIGEETLGPHHPDLATWLNNLANLLIQKSDFNAAEPLYQRAISIMENTFPDGHPNLDLFGKNYANMLAKRDQQ